MSGISTNKAVMECLYDENIVEGESGVCNYYGLFKVKVDCSCLLSDHFF